MDYQNTNPYMTLSGISNEELMMLEQGTASLNDEQKKYFFMIYSGKRKSPQDMLIFCLIGTFAIPGFQRFITGQIGMGILFLFTAGLCFIGTIIDLINHKKMALEYNQKMAAESFSVAKMAH